MARDRGTNVPTSSAASSRGSDPSGRWVLWVGVATVVAATAGHYLTPSSSPQFHDALRRVYYLPIVLVGVKRGLGAGLFIAAFTVLCYFPHIWTHWGGDPLGPGNLNRTFEMVMWIAVGGISGLLAQRERTARTVAEQAQAAAEQARDAAEKSSREARAAATSLLEAEDRLRRADRMATLGFLSASLAHEVRNPLGSLKGIADLLRRDFPEGHPRRELVEILDAEVQRLDGVVARYLEQARPDPGIGPVRVAEAARGVVRLLTAEAAKKGLTCEVDVEPEDVSAPIPQDLLRQVLLNLALNSLQAMEGRDGVVRIKATQTSERVEIAVEDDGPGFPQEMIGQVTNSSWADLKGSAGLGLRIVRQIVESHGGRLAVLNRREGGARVVVAFGDQR